MENHVTPSIDALRLAAESGADPRTCERALRHGPEVIRIRAVRLGIERAAERLSIVLASPEARSA